MEIHIGLDDIDSLSGGCTTHLATLLACKLVRDYGARLIEPLNLVRLNPSIPWKTRGNGAVAIRLLIPEALVEDVVKCIKEVVLAYVSTYRGSLQDPGVALVIGSVPRVLARFYDLAVRDAVTMDIALSIAKNHNVRVILEGKGSIGALAAIGWILSRRDYSYELLAYRSRDHLGERYRCVDADSVTIFESRCRSTFNNVYGGKPLISPHGPDPVLYGVRGDDPIELLEALKLIRVCEPISAYALFITNQGTDDHVRYRLTSASARAYRCGWLVGSVVSKPRIIQGGHVVIELLDEQGKFKAIVFRETEFSNVASRLSVGAVILVQGCFKPYENDLYLHVEKLQVLHHPTLRSFKAYRCPRCGRKMKYLGLGRGFRCTNCGLIMHLPPRYEISSIYDARIYVPPPNRQKHLVKPIDRYVRHPLPKCEAVIECYEPICF